MKVARRRTILAHLTGRDRTRVAVALTVAILSALADATAWYRRDTSTEEIRKIASVMRWRDGTTIAEIGAGDGLMSAFAAERVGPRGHVYANELDASRLERIQALASSRGLSNLTVVAGTAERVNLPHDCCDAVFMRDVYHHLAMPAAIAAGISRAVHPGGYVAVADHRRTPLRQAVAFVRGHSADGVSPDIVIRDLTAAGFTSLGEVGEWPARGYCLLFRKQHSDD